MNAFTIGLLIFFGADFVVLISWGIYTAVKQYKKCKAFFVKYPQYVKLRVRAQSTGSSSFIKIKSVNGEEAAQNKYGDILLPVGENTIKAYFASQSENNKYGLILLSMIGGVIGAVFLLIYLVKDAKFKNTSGEITIKLNTVHNGSYELKADQYDKKFTVICIEGEKHRIESFG